MPYLIRIISRTNRNKLQPARTKLDLIQKTKSDKCTRNISAKCIRNQTRSQVAILVSAVLISPSKSETISYDHRKKLFLHLYLFVLSCTTINISVLVAIYSTVIKRPSSLTSDRAKDDTYYPFK